MKTSAGFCGPDVRGDCRATVWKSDKPEILIRSRVLALYGNAIREQASEVLEACGAAGFSLEIEDDGALPFTIGARIEAALLRSGSTLTGKWLPAVAKRSPTQKLRRSRLYLPGNTPKLFINAGLYGADAIILDLEDAVPQGEKDVARVLVRNALRAINFGVAERMVRINKGCQNDVEAVREHGVETIILPKTETAADVLWLEALTDETIGIVPLIETALGVENAREIAGASPRVSGLSIGLEDYVADIGASRTEAGEESRWAISRVVNAARAAGVQPLGPVFTTVDDPDELDRRIAHFIGFGFEGFSCIHPMQVRHVHKSLMPSAAEIESARRIASGYKLAVESGQGTVAVDGKMVDAPVAARAERLLRQAGLAS